MEDWKKCWTPQEWAAILGSGPEESAQIREATYAGRPLGSTQFIERLEVYLRRSLKRGTPDRPRKQTTSAARCG